MENKKLQRSKRRQFVGVEIDSESLDDLRLLAEATQYSVSALVRDAVTFFLAKRTDEIAAFRELTKSAKSQSEIAEILRRDRIQKERQREIGIGKAAR